MLHRLLGPGGHCDWRLAKAAMRKAAGPASSAPLQCEALSDEIIKGADAALRKLHKDALAKLATGGPTPSDKRITPSDKQATSTSRTPSSSAKQPVKSPGEKAADGGSLATVAPDGPSGQLAPSDLLVISLC